MKNKQKPNPVITFIKKLPLTFQLFRSKNPIEFERMLFVIKACSKSGKYSILHVEQTRTGSRLVATDGLRLHVAEISKKIKSGNYKPHFTKDIISLGKPINNFIFPLWEKVIPEKTVRRGIINLTNSGISKNRQETEKLSLAFNSFVKQSGETINLRYLEDLTKHEWIIYCQNEKRDAILLKEKSNLSDAKVPFAVILPIRQAA